MTTRLGELTWPEVEARRPMVLVVPVGSLEQHGPHLPLDTDTRIAEAVAASVCDDDPRLVLAPPVAVGASGEHAGFPGTLSIGTEALADSLVELVRSADAFAGVVLLNAHGGNAAALRRVASTAAAEGRHVLVVACAVDVGDAHAGHTETSLLLHLCPGAVRSGAAAPGDTTPWPELAARVCSGGVRGVSANGVLGDPTSASPEAGERIFGALVEEARTRVEGWLGARR